MKGENEYNNLRRNLEISSKRRNATGLAVFSIFKTKENESTIIYTLTNMTGIYYVFQPHCPALLLSSSYL